MIPLLLDAHLKTGKNVHTANNVCGMSNIGLHFRSVAWNLIAYLHYYPKYPIEYFYVVASIFEPWSLDLVL